MSERMTISAEAIGTVSAILQVPSRARACFVLAHGAGAGMTHPSLEGLAADLHDREIASLRFQFPFMERGTKRPDPPAIARATVRAAVATAAQRLPELVLIAGGRSFGGRMASQAQAAAPLPGVRGLAFVGFPLHPAKRPSAERAVHLSGVAIPDAVRPGHPGRPRRPAAASAGLRGARQPREPVPDRRRGSFLPCAKAIRSNRHRGPRRDRRRDRRLGRH